MFKVIYVTPCISNGYNILKNYYAVGLQYVTSIAY